MMAAKFLVLVGKLGSVFGCVRSAKGATAVEFAIIAPIFLIMLLATFEVGRAMWIKGTMQYAVEETARYSMVNTAVKTACPTGATSACTTFLTTYFQDKLPGLDTSSITFQAAPLTDGTNVFLSLTGTHDFQVLVKIIPLPDIILSAKSRAPLNP